MTRLILSAYINGVPHRMEDYQQKVKEGDPVTFVAEPENPYDPEAVKVLVNGEHAGYIPREQTPVYHDAMRKGATNVIARVTEIPGKKFKEIIFQATADFPPDA